MQVEFWGSDGALKLVIAKFTDVDVSVADARCDIAISSHCPVVLSAELSAELQRADSDELLRNGFDILLQEVDDGFRQ